MSKSATPIPAHVVAKFARLKDGTPIGLVAATKGPTGAVTVSWSFTAKVDRQPGRISKSRAWDIVLSRAVSGSNASIPGVLLPIVQEIKERAVKYFKVSEVQVVGC